MLPNGEAGLPKRGKRLIKGMHAIMARDKPLRKLYIGYNQITDNGIIVALPQLKDLSTLSVWECGENIEDRGEQALNELQNHGVDIDSDGGAGDESSDESTDSDEEMS